MFVLNSLFLVFDISYQICCLKKLQVTWKDTFLVVFVLRWMFFSSFYSVFYYLATMILSFQVTLWLRHIFGII